jgi:hypothetical protein
LIHSAAIKGGLRVVRFQNYRQTERNRFPPKRSAKASASSGLEKQNTTKSLSSRRREYVSGDADKLAAKPRITAPILLLVPQFSVMQLCNIYTLKLNFMMFLFYI